MYGGAGHLAPYSPFTTTFTYGDHQIEEAQGTLYYLTTRFRAILLHRLSILHHDSLLPSWNAHFAMEIVRTC